MGKVTKDMVLYNKGERSFILGPGEATGQGVTKRSDGAVVVGPGAFFSAIAAVGKRLMTQYPKEVIRPPQSQTATA